MTGSRSIVRTALSIAISTALAFGAISVANAGAAESPDAGAAGAQAQPAPAPSPAQAGDAAQSSAAADDAQAQGKPAPTLQTVQVIGVKGSMLRSIQQKQMAPTIEDAITAEGIGQLPDVTISDSLQRVTGVQIDRTGGVGSTVEVRGLPEVATLMNGHPYISASNINSMQPDFLSVPSELMSGVVVMKSPMASMLTSGISGTIDLRTRMPWDMPFGWSFAGSLGANRGDVTKDTGPNASFMTSYNAHGKWGALLDISHSDSMNESSQYGPDVSSGSIAGENAVSAQSGSGFVGSFGQFPIPSGIKQFPNGDVDVNGDGASDLAMYAGHRQTVFQVPIRLRRTGVNAAFQYGIGDSLTFTATGFWTKLNEYNNHVGIEALPQSFLGKTLIPLVTRNTGVPITNPFNTSPATPGWNQTFYTTSSYQDYPADLLSDSESLVTQSISRNYTAKLDFDNGGPLTGSFEFDTSTAHQAFSDTDIQFSTNNGTLWPNHPVTAAPPGVFIYPNGNRVFNPNGFVPDTVPMTFDYTNGLAFSTTPEQTARMQAEDGYALKGLQDNSDNYNRHASLNVAQLNGKYTFNDNLKLSFGFRNSVRSANNNEFTLASRLYAGEGASDANGCLVKYFTADVVLDGQGVPGACAAGNDEGAFRGGVLSSQPPGALPALLSQNMQQYHNLDGVSGLDIWALNPVVMENGYNFLNSLYPGIRPIMDPATSWKVGLHERAAYAQADFSGAVGDIPVSGNAGVRVVRTNLAVTQFRSGESQPYGLPAAFAGVTVTDRTYTDILPALNLDFSLTPKLHLRLAGSKNMMPLNLDQWGGGLSIGYAIDTTSVPGQTIFAADSASSSGNPNLKPWRSTNTGASVEYYFNDSTMASLAAYRIKVGSFLVNGTVSDCNIPDIDGVVRRCVGVTEPVQGSGATITGYEADWQQAATFLPGFLSHTGYQVNFTYSPSTTGKNDMAGNPIPFPDNSKESGNVILWYQDSKLQLRVAYNYRSKEAFAENVGGINGFERYIAPQHYVDASASYALTKNVQLFVQGTNLTGESQKYYDVWPDQPAYTFLFERRYFAGVRLNW